MELIDLSVTDNPVAFMGKLADQQQLEQTIFSKAAALSQSYRGGDWRYVGSEQNIVFMAPNSSDSFEVLNFRGGCCQPDFRCIRHVSYPAWNECSPGRSKVFILGLSI